MRRPHHPRWPLVLVLLAGGCFDFASLGRTPRDLSANPPLPVGDMADDDGGDPSPQACGRLEDCPAGYNCVAKLCRSASVSCAAHKSAWPGAADGVYWIAPSEVPELAYCDMHLGAELCTTRQHSHNGKTREGSGLAFSLTSVLSADGRTCDLWAVHASDGFPLGVWEKEDNEAKLTQCQVLGFLADVAIGECPYGSSSGYSNCGFPVVPLYAYGHQCENCKLNPGTFKRYTKMGPFTGGSVLSSVDGTVRARCKTR